MNIFYTAPTAIRTFMKWGDEWPKKHKLDSLRLLGTVGEPINPEAWMWYREVIGHNRCPIVDTWWQTETGHIMITPIPGAIATKPGSATRPFPGVVPEVVTMDGKPVPEGSGGFLVLKQPWPGMLRTIYGDPDRYVSQYWSQIPPTYFTGDGARKDKDGYFWVMGRVDDVINVSGHRLSTMEVESALVAHEAVAEAAVVARPDDIKGQAISAFVTLEQGRKPTPELKDELRKWVAKEIGAMAKPDDIRFTDTAAENPQRENHAPPVARAGQQRRSEGRHHHARRLRRHREVERERRSVIGPRGDSRPRLSSRAKLDRVLKCDESAIKSCGAALRQQPRAAVPTWFLLPCPHHHNRHRGRCRALLRLDRNRKRLGLDTGRQRRLNHGRAAVCIGLEDSCRDGRAVGRDQPQFVSFLRRCSWHVAGQEDQTGPVANVDRFPLRLRRSLRRHQGHPHRVGRGQGRHHFASPFAIRACCWADSVCNSAISLRQAVALLQEETSSQRPTLP